MKFTGTKDDLETIVTGMGRTISNSEKKVSLHQIKTTEGGTLNLYPNGTLQIQGSPLIKQKFEKDYSAYIGEQAQIQQPRQEVSKAVVSEVAIQSKQVFIVHGHDETSREQLELILHKLGLNPFVLQNSGGSGLTIIEALEERIGKDSSTTDFGIVLMTPDDMGYAISSGEENLKPRARQNVVLEMGMLISSVSRKNMAILIKGSLEKPSDADGILYLSFKDHVKETVPKLASHLNKCGFVLSPSKITHASS